MRPRAVAALLGAWLLLAPPSFVFALDDVAHMTWEQLIQRAQESAARHDDHEALVWAQKAAAIRLSPSLRVFMIGSQRAVGDWASAYANATMCVSEATEDLKLPMRDKILATCQDAVTTLTPLLGELSISLPSPVPPGTKVTIGGVEVLPALLALPYRVNPGSSTVDVVASGYVPFHQDVSVSAAGVAPVTVVLKAEAPQCVGDQVLDSKGKTCVDAPPVAAAPSAPALPAPAPLTVEPVARQEPPARNPAGLVVGGIGVAVAIGGTIAWVASSSKYSKLHTDCRSAVGCSIGEWNAASSAVKTLDAVSVTGWTVGSAMLIGGLAWYVLSGTATSSSDTSWNLTVDPVARSIGASGRF